MTRISSPTHEVMMSTHEHSAPAPRLLVIPDFTTRATPLRGEPPQKAKSTSQPSPAPIASPAIARPNPTATGAREPAATGVSKPLTGPDVVAPPPPRIDTPDPRSVQNRGADSDEARITAALQAANAGVVLATQKLRQLANGLPRRTTLGWQRTVLLLLGGALLAYGVHGGWRRGTTDSESVQLPDIATVQSEFEAEIPRMSRAPLRVDAVSRETPHVEPQQVEPKPTPPAAEFPVIGAPDGSEVSQRQADNPRDSQTGLVTSQPTVPETSSGIMEAFANRPRSANEQQPTGQSADRTSVPRQTLAESAFPTSAPTGRRQMNAAPRPAVNYPHTDPSTYRDPQYSVPSMAERRHESPR